MTWGTGGRAQHSIEAVLGTFSREPVLPCLMNSLEISYTETFWAFRPILFSPFKITVGLQVKHCRYWLYLLRDSWACFLLHIQHIFDVTFYDLIPFLISILFFYFEINQNYTKGGFSIKWSLHTDLTFRWISIEWCGQVFSIECLPT